jgi:molybdate transport system permease protein
VFRNTHTTRSPRGVIPVAMVGLLLLALPIIAMLIRVPWSAVPEIVTDESNRSALFLSLRTSVLATLLSVAVGAPVAWLIAHHTFPGMRIIRALCVLPMVLPPVVGGVALIYVLGKNGVIGQYLWDWFGIRIAFTESAAVLAQFFVAAPYFIVVMESAFTSVDPALVGVSRSLGARPWNVLLHVQLPLVRPALIAGLVLTWARALGEFGATITFAGNTQGRTQTLPLAVYTALESGRDAALLLSVVLIVVSFTVLVSLRAHWTSGVFRRGQA